MPFIRQFLALLQINLAGIPHRAGSALTIVVGVTCAVGVLVSMLAMGAGSREQEFGDVRADRVVISSIGARGIAGNIPRDELAAVQGLPYIRRSFKGEPIVVPEALVPMQGRRRVTGVRIFFPLVGVGGEIGADAPELHITAGRMFRRGLHELVASDPCARQFTGFDIGDRRSIRGIDWTVVGHFLQGKSEACIVYADVDSLMSAFDRNSYQRISVTLKSPADFAAFRAAVRADPSLHLEVLSEREATERDFKPLNGLLSFVSYFLGGIMAIAATFGSVNSLYSMVDSRRRELATLRAIGFGSATVIATTLFESILLALPGALLGSALAWALFEGMSVSPFGYSFRLAVTPSLAALGVVWALAMGLIGGLLPAIHAGRASVAAALRAA